jgi:hypothetical protein
MRYFLTFLCLLIVSGCAEQPVAGGSETDLQSQVGQNVTLSGKFELYGKIGPFIYYNGQPVYLVPQGSYKWGPEYDRMEGQVVNVSGVLNFRHFPRTSMSTVEQPVDYFYFDAETAKVELK